MSQYYRFPVIKHLDQVLPYIKDNANFTLKSEDDYWLVKYGLYTPEVFSDTIDRGESIRRECRGITFDKNTGNISSRPLHKFFNYKERKETENVNLHIPHEVFQKLDGSMIRPIYFSNKYTSNHWRLGTKSGITDISMQAEEFIANKPDYKHLIDTCHAAGHTPIFEWCSRKNKVVIDHPTDRLVLIAVRDMESGRYIDIPEWKSVEVAQKTNIVKLNNMSLFNESVKKETNNEGYVIRFKTGHMVKVKSDWYVGLHKSKGLLSQEKNVVKAILDGTIDDILPALSIEDRQRVEAFARRMTAGFNRMYTKFVSCYLDIASDCLTKKDFALALRDRIDPKVHAFLFVLYQKEDAGRLKAYMTEKLLQACTTATRLEEFRWLIGGNKLDVAEQKAEAALHNENIKTS